MNTHIVFRDGLILSFCAMTLLIMLGRDAGSHWLGLTCSGRTDMLSMNTEQNILSHLHTQTHTHTSGRVEGPILCFLSEKHHRLYTADISLCCLRRRRDEKRSLMYNSDLWETLKSLHNIRIMQQVSLRAPFSLFNLGQSLFEKSEKSPSSDI